MYLVCFTILLYDPAMVVVYCIWACLDDEFITSSVLTRFQNFRLALPTTWGVPRGSDGKESGCKAEDRGLIPGLGRSPGEENDNPFRYSCLENPMDKEPGGLQSTWSQRVRHDWATNTCLQCKWITVSAQWKKMDNKMYILAEKTEWKTLTSTQHPIHLFPYILLLHLTEATKTKLYLS